MDKYNFSYDADNDDLFLYKPKSVSKGSVEFGNVILDFNNKKDFVGIQIMQVSKVISEMLEGKDKTKIKSMLEQLKDSKIETKINGNILIIKLFLVSETGELHPILNLPHIKQASPSLAYA